MTLTVAILSVPAFLLGFMFVLIMALVGHLAGRITGWILAWAYYKIARALGYDDELTRRSKA